MDDSHGKQVSVKGYRAIAEYLRQGIDSGKYRCGDKLPSEKELSTLFHVSRSSVREALTALEYIGFIEVRGGSGYYVSGHQTIPADGILSRCHAKVIFSVDSLWGIKTLKSLLQKGLDGVCLSSEDQDEAAWSRSVRAVWQAVHDAAVAVPVLAELSAAEPGIAGRVRLITAAKVDGIIITDVKTAEQVLTVRRALDAADNTVLIFSYLTAVCCIEEITRVSDGIILDANQWESGIPFSDIISRSNLAGKQVYLAVALEETAAYGLNPGSEAITKAALSGCDGVFIRTAGPARKYPDDALSLLREAALTAQEKLFLLKYARSGRIVASPAANALCCAAVQAAAAMKAVALVVPTETGLTPRLLAKFRQGPIILAVTHSAQVMRRLRLVWGVQPLLSRRTMRRESIIQLAVKTALQAGYLSDGDAVVGVMGNMDVPESYNSIQLITVGDVILRGQGIGGGIVTGRVAIIDSSIDTSKRVSDKIMVIAATDAEHIPQIQDAAGLIVEEGGFSSHAAISCLALGKPAIIGAADATQLLLEDEQITIDFMRGLVFRGWVNLGQYS